MSYPDEGYRWAVVKTTNEGQKHEYFRSWDDAHERPRVTTDRYAAKTWATFEAARRNATNLGYAFVPVRVFL